MVAPLLSQEYKNIVADSTPEVAKAVVQLINQYSDRIIAFGFKSLDGYGVQLPEPVKEDIGNSMRDYLAECVKNFGSFYQQIMARPELARDEDKLENLLSASRELQAVADNSEVVNKLKAALAQSGQKIHKDALAHIIELTVRDPLFRFMMKQVAKQYTAKLQEQGHAVS